MKVDHISIVDYCFDKVYMPECFDKVYMPECFDIYHLHIPKTILFTFETLINLDKTHNYLAI